MAQKEIRRVAEWLRRGRTKTEKNKERVIASHETPTMPKHKGESGVRTKAGLCARRIFAKGFGAQ